jgi:hypothetical protein
MDARFFRRICMTRRMLLTALLVYCCVSGSTLAAAATDGDVLHAGRISREALRWQPMDDGTVRPQLSDSRPVGTTDAFDLPARDLLLLVPADLTVDRVLIEPVSTTMLSAPGPLAVRAPLQTSTGETVVQQVVTGDDGSFPGRWGMSGGLHAWRGYRLLAVTIFPLRVHETNGGPRVEMLTEYRVRVLSDGGTGPPRPLLQRERAVPGERSRIEAALAQTVENPAMVPGYQRQDGLVLDKSGAPHLPAPLPSLDGTGVRYLIVTSEALAGEFQRLADHRTAMGLPAKVVTREWIEANHRRGIDFQETLRMFLQEAYAKWGMEYLLIGGDTNIIPTRFVRSTFYPFGGHTDVPTDLYYAALDGNWGADGDGWLGEPYLNEGLPGDDADMAPEIAVGRAPVQTPAMVQNFVDKVLGYEATPAGSGWTNRVLFASEVLFPSPWDPQDPITLDGAQYSQDLIETTLTPCSDLESVRMYQTDQLFERDAPLNRAALIDSLNTGHYGQFNQFGHGHFFNMSVGDANFTVSDAAALVNPHHFLLFAVNCASGAFDLSCLMERFVENPDGGAIVSVGAAREAFPSNSYGYQSAFYDNMLCGGVRRTGEALNLARLQYISNTHRNTVDRWTQLNAVIIGDPAVSIWTGSPRVPTVSGPEQLSVGEQTVTVIVSGPDGAAVAGADVALRKAGETYAWGMTDFNGRVNLTVIPRTAGEAELTVSGKDLAHTTIPVPVSVAGSYVGAEDLTVQSGGNGDQNLEAGEAVDIALSLRETGGVATGPLTVTLTSADSGLQVIDGQTTVPALDADASTVATGLSLQAAATVQDATVLELRVTVADGGASWVSTLPVEVRAPEPEVIGLVIDDATHGNGDGLWQDGERLVLQPEVKNYGSGRLDQLQAGFTAVQEGVTIHSGQATFAPLELLESSGVVAGELSLSLSDVGAPQPCRLLLVDNFGRTFEVPLEFSRPQPPSAITTDPTLADDAIVVRWDPADGERVKGYHVYRSPAAEGPWTRANRDLLDGIAYFEDRGLEQLTPYWYKITAVSESYLESEFSGVVTQGTMPAEAENFPLPFQLQTSGHPVVGDVDGDDEFEIVLGADEVYVWNADGSEIVDGDDDAQTTGPITRIDGQFGPAGVTLGELDGQPGLEIIASERANAREIHALRSDGTPLPGWPRALLGSWNWATPAVGDLDGDGDNEIVVNDTGGRTFVWHHDGTELRDGDNDPGTDGVFLDRNETWGFSSPALFDVDGDGGAEILFGTRYDDGTPNGLEAYDADGTLVPGFPVTTGGHQVICSPAVADLDRDGNEEIIFFSTGHELFVVGLDGSSYPGFPVSFDTNFDDSAGPSPAVGDFDDDTDLEIVWPVNGGQHRLDIIVVDTGRNDGSSGQFLDGWPVQLAANSEGSPVVGDIDGDGVADIIQPIGNSNTETPDLVHALKADGTEVAGFPIRLDGHCRSTPVICDLEQDGDVDVVYGSWDRLLHVWDMPFAYDPVAIPWPTFQGNPARTGVARQLSLTPVDDAVDVPAALTVQPPHPNPFNPTTTIRLYVAPGEDRHLEVSVFDLRGRRVRELHRGAAPTGWLELTWDGRDDVGRSQASGVYFVQARQGDSAETHKLTLVK